MAYERREIVTETPRVVESPRYVNERVVETPRYVEEEVVTRPAVADVDRAAAVTYDPYERRRTGSYKLVSAIYLVFGFIETLIVIRFVLKVLGADPSAGFAQLIYGVTNGLVAPFVGLFGTPAAGNGSVFEPHSLIALVVYALVAWLIAKIAWLVFGETRSAIHTSATTVDTRVR
jgi:hypothetical protein